MCEYFCPAAGLCPVLSLRLSDLTISTLNLERNRNGIRGSGETDLLAHGFDSKEEQQCVFINYYLSLFPRLRCISPPTHISDLLFLRGYLSLDPASFFLLFSPFPSGPLVVLHGIYRHRESTTVAAAEWPCSHPFFLLEKKKNTKSQLYSSRVLRTKKEKKKNHNNNNRYINT